VNNNHKSLFCWRLHLQKSSAAFLLIVVSITSVLGDGKSGEHSVAKVKREASIGAFSYTASDVAKTDGSHVKTMTVLKSFEPSGGAVDSSSYSSFSSLIEPVVKTTVEFWPSDLDKEKFYSMKDDPSLDLWQQNKETKVIIKKPLPENLPDIPISPWKPMSIPIGIKYESLLESTEAIVINDVAVTNPGPVVFPTNEPTTKNPERAIAFVSRGNNKKRKLKKKVKIALQPARPSKPVAPFSSTEVVDEKSKDDVTPIHEVIDEPMLDIFEPIRYTDVVNNLSSLTEQTFGDQRDISSSENTEISSPASAESQVSDVNPITVANIFESRYVNGKSGSETDQTSESTSMPMNIKDLMPLERMFTLLKQAIDERNIAKIKRIVSLLEEPKTGVAQTGTTELAAKPTQASSTLAMSSSTTVEVAEASEIMSLDGQEATTAKSKVYLAPRVRIAQKKIKLKTKVAASDEKLKESSSVTVSETIGSTVRQANPVKSATEALTTAEPNTPSQAPTRRNRAHRSHTTPRMRKGATASRQAAKNSSSRRVGRKPVRGTVNE
jgi:hypothetical protein